MDGARQTEKILEPFASGLEPQTFIMSVKAPIHLLEIVQEYAQHVHFLKKKMYCISAMEKTIGI